MIIRADHRELIDIIKDMTNELPDCQHHPADPNSCYICAGKLITEADNNKQLAVLDKHPFDGGRYGNGKDHSESRKRIRAAGPEAFYKK